MTSHVAQVQPGGGGGFSRKEIIRLILAVLAAVAGTIGVSETVENDPPPVQVNCPPVRTGQTVDAGVR